MHRFFIPQPFAEEMQIIGADAHHISNVLRMRVGQHIQIVSSDRVTALMEIKALTTDAAFVRLVKRIEQVNEPSVRIILAQGLAKGEKMDFIIQKAVEVGVNTIVPVAMEHSVVKLDKNKAEKKVERWQKIAEEAAKQSKRDIVPEVTSVMDLDEVLHSFAGSAKLMAYEGETKSGLKKVLSAISAIVVVASASAMAAGQWVCIQDKCGKCVINQHNKQKASHSRSQELENTRYISNNTE